MARTLPRTTPLQPFYRFVGSLRLTPLAPHAGSNVRVYRGTFSKADDEVPHTLIFVRFKPKADASRLGVRKACLSVNNKLFWGVPFTTVNITPFGSTGVNSFSVWGQAIPTLVTVYAERVLKVPEEQLLRSLGDDSPFVHKRADTLDLVKGHFDGSSGDAVVEILQVSLVCPLSRKRMKIPCRGVGCLHVQCFDAYTYLAANESTHKPSWCCPVCDMELPVEDMRVDLFTLSVLQEAEEHCDDVRFFPDGHWENVAAGKDEHSVILIEDSPVKTD